MPTKTTEHLTQKRLVRLVGETRFEADVAHGLLTQTEHRLAEVDEFSGRLQEELEGLGGRRAAILKASTEATRIALEEALELLRAAVAAVEELNERLPEKIGLSVEQVAARLGVSQPTVRKWLADGYLDAIPQSKPTEIAVESVVALDAALERARIGLGETSRGAAIAAYLYDRSILDSEQFERSVAAARRGRAITLAE
jgi:transcriptional regulator with XRE-family HTH domain